MNDASPLPEPEEDTTGACGKHVQTPPQGFVDPAVSISTVIAGKYKLVEVIGEGGHGQRLYGSAERANPGERLL